MSKGKLLLSIHFLTLSNTPDCFRKQRKLARKLREAIETYQGEAGAYMKTLDEGASNAVMQKWEARTITQPTIPLICFYLAFRCIAFFVVPMSYLIYTNNVAGVVIFIFMSIVCFERHYLDMNVILENMGNFGSMGRKFEQEGSMLRSEGVLGVRRFSCHVNSEAFWLRMRLR